MSVFTNHQSTMKCYLQSLMAARGLAARRRVLGAAGILGVCLAQTATAQLIYQEGFNDDGEKATPPRYTMTGRAVYDVDRIQSELNNFDQKGPLFWDHNFNTTFVGNPDIPARRMILSWRGNDASAVTEEFLKVLDSSVNWLLKGKKGARVLIFPAASNAQGLADRLTALGHTVVDDDLASTPDERDVVGDLFIHAQAAGNPSRFVLSPKPVIVINAPDFDDMLVGSIGSSVAFTPGKVTIGAAGHPAAGGKTGSFDGFTGEHTFELTGSFLPPGVTKLATVSRTVPPAINRLSDVDSVIAGTKQNEKTAGSVAQIDFSDGSAGNWTWDNPVPGGYAGNWGLQITGKINVTRAGTYRFAVGSDDGARFYVDKDKNGITIADQVLEDTGPHGHQIVYADVNFSATGVYDIELRSYNSSGGGDVELSVANVVTPVPDDALDSGFWEVLGDPAGTSPVKLQGSASVNAFKAAGPNVEVQEPLITLLNGPDDTPRGEFYDGGAFTGFEGRGFIGASGLNKWPYPDGQAYRSLQLKPVNVAGKSNVKVTVALAATQVDFETSDFIQVYAYPNGANSTAVQLGNFRGVANAVQPWLADEKEKFSRKLTKQFADFTFDVPAGATDLIVEVRAATTWWTEIAAVDNIRIHSGPLIPASSTEYGIGLNFGAEEANGNNKGTLAAADVAGVASVAQANWNNLKTATGSATTGIVADVKGTAQPTSVTVTWRSGNTWASTGRGEENNKFTENNLKLTTGYLDTGNATTTTVSIASIPAKLTEGGYDVYVYALGGVGGRGGAYRVMDTESGKALTGWIRAQSPTNSSDFVEATLIGGTDPNGAARHAAGNYIVFKGLTSANITVLGRTAGFGFSGTPRAPINAIQLVSPGGLQEVTLPGDKIESSHAANKSPGGEQVVNAIDNDFGTKYLNFGGDNSTGAPFDPPVGLTVTPSAGPSIVTALRLVSANDAPERDPAAYKLEGSNDGTTFSLISEGDVPAFAGRFTPVTISFPNTVKYAAYRLTIPKVKNNTAANSMQIAEVDLLGKVFPLPKLGVSAAAGKVTVTFSGGNLEQAVNVEGPYTPVQNAKSPYETTADGPAKFFRSKQ
ncbi:MAG: hypothetical protein FJ404_07410 [Verrucomicrobia bacterium]|nr:hypothetical protein [Verrucomicrobiota bacterium]